MKPGGVIFYGMQSIKLKVHLIVVRLIYPIHFHPVTMNSVTYQSFCNMSTYILVYRRRKQHGNDNILSFVVYHEARCSSCSPFNQICNKKNGETLLTSLFILYCLMTLHQSSFEHLCNAHHTPHQAPAPHRE